jgi:hypothetical protein
MLECLWLGVKEGWDGIIQDIVDELINRSVWLDGWFFPTTSVSSYLSLASSKMN